MKQQTSWTDKDIKEMQSAYSHGTREPTCPICERKVTIKTIEGEENLKKKYVDTHYFLDFKCSECGRKDTRTYRKGYR